MFSAASALQRAQAAREVILSAGAIQSPQLLQLSGIGPRGPAAAALDIPVVADLAGVGENLQDHYQARTIVRLRKRRVAQRRRAQSAQARRDGLRMAGRAGRDR